MLAKQAQQQEEAELAAAIEGESSVIDVEAIEQEEATA